MSDVYIDIRVKIPSKEVMDHCNHDLENAFYIGQNLCSDIKDLKGYDYLTDVDIVNMGKLSPLLLEFSEDCLMEDSD